MARFKVGQKVVCKYGNGDWQIVQNGRKHTSAPMEGEIVTIREYVEPLDGDEYFVCYEHTTCALDENDFEPLMDITELTEILEQQPEEAPCQH